MTFAHACREADKKRRRSPADARLKKLRRLLDISLDHAWHELNRPLGVRIATIYAAEFLLQVGDVQRWRQWFDAHTVDERAGILRHLEKRRGRQST